MEILISLALFAAGLFLVVKGADFLVDGASSIAKKFKVSDLVIGLTIIAFGTSLPELIVSVIAGFNPDTAPLTMGNILGSNIANIFLILGISAVIKLLQVKSSTVWKEIPLNLLATLVVIGFSYDAILSDSDVSAITRNEGIALLGLFAIFMYYTFELARNSRDAINKEAETVETKIPPRRSIILIGIGIIGLGLGGHLAVNGASGIAEFFGISELIIGLTVVAIGTSLPELVTSITAAKRGSVNMLVGNVVGSNIFNLLWILGFSSIINPIPFESSQIWIDHIFAVVASILVFLFLFTGVPKSRYIDRREGIIFVLLYVGYLGINIWRAVN